MSIEGAIMKIGELARRSRLTASRIRFYEAKGLLNAVSRKANGYRESRLLSQGRRLSMGVPGAYAGTRIHSVDRGGPL